MRHGYRRCNVNSSPQRRHRNIMNGTLPGKGVTDEQVTDVVTKWMDVQPQKRKTFVFVAGVEDVRWNMKLNRNLVLWTGGV